jgi:hypothetical protein
MSRILEALDPEILDDRIGKQLAAHVLDVGFLGSIGEVELDQFAGADVVHARKAETLERVVDRLALGVEDSGLESDENARFHGPALSEMSGRGPYGCGAAQGQALDFVYLEGRIFARAR